jgi:uncharacterized membrane protein
MSGPAPAPHRDFDRVIGRILIWLTYVAVALLAVGVALMLAAGISPLDGAPPFDLAAIPADVAALRPVGFLWLGLLAILITPIARVIVAGIGYALDREWVMVLVAIAILAVIAVGVLSATLTEV